MHRNDITEESKQIKHIASSSKIVTKEKQASKKRPKINRK